MNVSAFLSAQWKTIRALNNIFQPARISLVLSILAPVLFLVVPQACDIVFALGEQHTTSDQPAHVAWFFVALTFFGLTNWYGPRFLFNCDFSGAAPTAASPGVAQPYSNLEKFLERHIPRLLGTVPIAIIGWAFLSAWWTNYRQGRSADTNHLGIAIGCFSVAAALYAFFIGRRSALRRVAPAFNAQNPRFTSVRQIAHNRPALGGFLFFLIPVLTLTALFIAVPVPVGFGMGSGAVLLFALASWACYGAIAIYFGHRKELPVLSMLAALAAVSSCFNDNHAIRTLDRPEAPEDRDTLGQRFEAWHNFVAKNYHPADGMHPLFLVVTEGGGIRAGYWTALVLSKLEDESHGRFSDHLFAISGVSGGSLGAATFNVLLANTKSGQPLAPQVPQVLGHDFLAPLVGKMCFPDFMQRLIFYPIERLDRGRALEDGWAANFKPFDLPFSQLYRPNRHLPELFFNGTDLEHGGRVITSTVRWDTKDFVDALEGVEKMDHASMRLSTAVHASARFTYFSPAGRYPDGSHVVDGGYFENSGGNTAHDILNLIRRHGFKDVRPIIVVLTNGPEKPPPTPEERQAEADSQRGNFGGSELLAPVRALLGTRTSHAGLSVGELRATLPVGDTFSFGLVDNGTVLPLGWTLSQGAMKEMDFQVDPEAQPATFDKLPPRISAEMKNSKTKRRLLDLLGP